MPASPSTGDSGRTDAEEALRTRRDHEAIGRLTVELLPALIAKLAASGLGEIEVRESGWKARLRKPAPEAVRKPSPRGVESVAHPLATSRAAASHGRAADERAAAEADAGIVTATSPAVGVYHPRRDLAVGMRVRSGDKIGWVDVLGVQQDVVAPVDGVIGSSLAEAGEGVEYGQELVRIEPPEADGPLDGPGSGRQPAVAGKA
jgi:biotin carboxyl carrier protein